MFRRLLANIISTAIVVILELNCIASVCKHSPKQCYDKKTSYMSAKMVLNTNHSSQSPRAKGIEHLRSMSL